jgi:hypothetical protein
MAPIPVLRGPFAAASINGSGLGVRMRAEIWPGQDLRIGDPTISRPQPILTDSQHTGIQPPWVPDQRRTAIEFSASKPRANALRRRAASGTRSDSTGNDHALAQVIYRMVQP